MKALVRLGILVPFLFWIALILGGLIHGNYNPFINTVSDAGALGTPSQNFMSLCEILIGALTFLFCVGATWACLLQKVSPIPIIVLLSFAVSIVWAGCFPEGSPNHGTLGALPLLILPGVLWALFAWKQRRFPIQTLAIISFLLMCGIFLRFVPTVNGPYPGLVQRIFYLGWSVWSCAVSAYLLEGSRLLRAEGVHRVR